MLLVKTKTAPSPIHGTGLFADEFISKGRVIWRFSKPIDEAYTEEEVQKLPEPKRSEILGLHFTYKSKETGRYILPGDDGRFINHSFTPTIETIFETGVEEDSGIAARDIQIGEELTVDYRVFDEEIDFEVES